MSQAPTSSLWTEDDDLTDDEEDQTLLGDDAYVETVVPAARCPLASRVCRV